MAIWLPLCITGWKGNNGSPLTESQTVDMAFFDSLLGTSNILHGTLTE